MEKVIDKIYYQIATDRHYKVGDKFEFGENLNNKMYDRAYNEVFRLQDLRLSDFVMDKKVTNKNKEALAKKLENYDNAIKELAIEEVRKEHFSECPSRLHCMFLSDSKEIVMENLQDFAKRGNGTYFQAVAVKLNGKIFKAGDVYMSREGQSYSYYKEKAYKYWSQTNVKNVKEILFEGTAEIVEILGETSTKN